MISEDLRADKLLADGLDNIWVTALKRMFLSVESKSIFAR
jgi:hypothetical protein